MLVAQGFCPQYASRAVICGPKTSTMIIRLIKVADGKNEVPPSTAGAVPARAAINV